MKALKVIVYTASFVVFALCLYAFSLGTGVFDLFAPRVPGTPPATLHLDGISVYFLAKGLFCSLSLYLSVTLIEAIHGLKAALVQNVKTTTASTVEPSNMSAPHHTVTVANPEKSWYQARQGVGH